MENASEKEDTSFLNLSVYRMQIEVLREVLYRLSQQHMENVVYDSNHIAGEIAMKEEGKVFLSVPFEKGWTVYVDGEETVTENYGDCFMMIPLQPGKHEIALQYEPVGKKEGIVISICGAVLFLLLAFMERKKEVIVEEELSEE